MSHIHLKRFAVLTRPAFHYKNLACLPLGVQLRIGRGTFKVSNRRENIFIYQLSSTIYMRISKYC